MTPWSEAAIDLVVGQRDRIARLLRASVITALLLILVVGFIAVGATSYHFGWEQRGNAVAAAQLKVERNLSKQLRQAMQRNAALAAEIEAEKAKQKVVYQVIRREVPRVVTHFSERPGAPVVPVPAWVVTLGFVRVWDDALAGLLPNPTGTAAAAAEAAEPASDVDRVEITAEDILGNHVDNAEQYKACRDQLEGLIAWHHANDSS